MGLYNIMGNTRERMWYNNLLKLSSDKDILYIIYKIRITHMENYIIY